MKLSLFTTQIKVDLKIYVQVVFCFYTFTFFVFLIFKETNSYRTVFRCLVTEVFRVKLPCLLRVTPRVESVAIGIRVVSWFSSLPYSFRSTMPVGVF